MRSSRTKAYPRRRAMDRLRAISNDPDFIIGAKEVLARKPFDYDARRNDKSQLSYENGRLIAIRVLQTSFCFLLMITLWAIPALVAAEMVGAGAICADR
jgi:hypothetical protein